MSFSINKKLELPFEETIHRLTVALQKEGFGVISEIDLKAKFQEKLQVNFRNYKILGACNPSLAYKAIGLEDKIGVLLPCNVLVQEHEGGAVEVSAINPLSSLGALENEGLQAIATEVSEKLKKVVAQL